MREALSSAVDNTTPLAQLGRVRRAVYRLFSRCASLSPRTVGILSATLSLCSASARRVPGRGTSKNWRKRICANGRVSCTAGIGRRQHPAWPVCRPIILQLSWAGRACCATRRPVSRPRANLARQNDGCGPGRQIPVFRADSWSPGATVPWRSCFTSGLRLAELAAVNEDDIDPQVRVLTVTGEGVKPVPCR